MKIRDKLRSNTYRKPDKIATTSERLQAILSERGMKQADLARATGISRGAISNYAIGRYEPKSDIVQKLAEVLSCSEMWLWGYDVPMERETVSYGDEENLYELELLDKFRSLTSDEQIYASENLEELVKNPEGEKISPGDLPITEGEKVLLSLFRKIPEEDQEMVLQMIRVALGSRELS